MVANVEVYAVDGPVVIYFQDGSSASIDKGESHDFQIIEGGFCTISDAPADGYEGVTMEEYLFEKFVRFWQSMVDQMHQEIAEEKLENAPKPTPY